MPKRKPTIQLYRDDCIKLIKTIADGSVDCICTDPPYAITSRGNAGNMSGYWTKDSSLRGNLFKYPIPDITDYIDDFARILKEGGHFYIMTNHINLFKILSAIYNTDTLHFTKCLIWDKVKKINGLMYMGQFEYIIFGRKKGTFRKINDCGSSDIISLPVKKLKGANNENLHNTEKPVELMEYLVKNSTNEGDIVLDPFMGIGSTGVACKNLNRGFIGIEIDNKYFEIAKNRIQLCQLGNLTY